MKRLVAWSAAAVIAAGGAAIGAEAAASPAVAPAGPGITRIVPQEHNQMVPRTHPNRAPLVVIQAGSSWSKHVAVSPDGKRFF